MRKIFVYSLDEEEQINKELGYTQKDYDKLSVKKQWAWTVGIPEIKDFIRRYKQKVCPTCNSKLEGVKECTYIGFRNPPGATGGSYEKTYEVVRKRYCPNCQKILD